MRFVKGRDNLAVTVYVPYNCDNKCSFCTSKQEYKGVEKGESFVTELRLEEVRSSYINEVVFTGGEPMMNLKKLRRLVDIVNNKDVYINTTLINKNLDRFIAFVNETPCIKGVNISRHFSTFKEDAKFMKDIAPDSYFDRFNKPIRINVVTPDTITDLSIMNILLRWAHLDEVEVSFRADFNKATPERLHSLDDPMLLRLLRFGDFVSRSYCDVCDTTRMRYDGVENDVDYSYHRGLANTSIKLGNTIIVNDIIIFPTGQLCYDWDHKCDGAHRMLTEFRVTPPVSSTDYPAKLEEVLRLAGQYMREQQRSEMLGYYADGSSCGGSSRVENSCTSRPRNSSSCGGGGC